MSVLAGLNPERVFYYFEELCRIPHGSGNTKEVSDYLVQFAKDHNLSWYQDDSNNVIIRRPASTGKMLQTLINEGITPVMAPLTHDGKGNILNTNADTIASETAKALAPYYDVTLIYSFEKKGVLSNPEDDDSVIPVITHADFERYKADGTVAGGMIPKLENALAAIDAGVKEVIITLATAIDGKHGTVIKS